MQVDYQPGSTAKNLLHFNYSLSNGISVNNFQLFSSEFHIFCWCAIYYKHRDL